jgi:hypothetical protein
MGTVSKEIAMDIIRGKYSSDRPETIVKYTNAWGGESYGVTFRGEPPGKYMVSSQYIIDPVLVWQIDEGYSNVAE